MSKIVLNDPNSGFNSASQLTENNETIEDHLNNKVLYRDNPSGEANAMQNDLDMNSYRILNLPSATQNSEPVTYAQWTANVQAVEFTGYLNETFTATAGQTAFTLANAYTLGIGAIRAYINGVYQAPSAYTETDANTITFSEGLDLGDQAAFVISSFDAAAATGANNITYTPAGVGAVASNVQTKLRESVSVKDFGAVGDGVADDYAAFLAAETYMLTSGRRGAILVPPGTYNLSQTLLMRGLSIGLEGEAGQTCTILQGTHTSGPVVHLQGDRSFIKGFEITSDATRMAGAAGDNYGLLLETADTPGSELVGARVEGVYVRKQPNSNIMLSGPQYSGSIIEWRSEDSQNGHGLQLDNGTARSRTNKGILGNIEIGLGNIYDNDGHAILLGNDDDGISNRVIRPHIYQCDMGRNALAAGSRKSTAQIWAYSSNGIIEQSGVNGADGVGTPVTNGMQLHGPNWNVRNVRMLVSLNNAISFDEFISSIPTSGVVDGLYCLQTGTTDLNPAIAVQPAVTGYVDIKRFVDNDIERLITDATNGRHKEPLIFHKTSTQSVTASTVLDDDDDLKCSLLARERVQFRAVLFVDAATAADIKIAFTVPSGAALQWAPTGGIRVNSSNTIVQQQAITASGTAVEFGCTTGNDYCVTVEGTVRTDGTAGDLQLQFAQVVSDAVASRILAGSYLEILR